MKWRFSKPTAAALSGISTLLVQQFGVALGAFSTAYLTVKRTVMALFAGVVSAATTLAPGASFTP